MGGRARSVGLKGGCHVSHWHCSVGCARTRSRPLGSRPATMDHHARAAIRLPPRTTYVELLRGKQQRKKATLAGGDPPLYDEFEPFSLAPPADHTMPFSPPRKPAGEGAAAQAPVPAPADQQPADQPDAAAGRRAVTVAGG
eukprot:468546-Prymnesium_polylepis.1